MKVGSGRARLAVLIAAACVIAVIAPLTVAQAVMGTHSFQQKLYVPDGGSGDGNARAVAIDSNALVTGAPSAPGGGAVYAYTRSLGVWGSRQEIVPPAGFGLCYFGAAVALDGDTLVVGAQKAALFGTDSGAVAVYRKTGSTWSLESTLTAPDAMAGALFGGSVALEGDRLVVGAYNDDRDSPGAGAAYVFQRTGSTWDAGTRLPRLTPMGGTNFGIGVAVSGDTIAVGASSESLSEGRIYVFGLSGGVWSQQIKIGALDASPGDALGRELAMSGNTIVAGADCDDIEGTYSGAAYVFVRNGPLSFAQQQKLYAADGGANDRFGCAVAVYGDMAVIGSRAASSTTTEQTGAAYKFVRSGTNWTMQQKLLASDGVLGDEYGDAVGIDMTSIVVGAPKAMAGTAQGVAYVYDNDSWGPTTTSDAAGPYAGVANITLTPADTGGSTIGRTDWILSGAENRSGSGTHIAVSTAGTYHLEFWSTDDAGNVETPHQTADFVVNALTQATWITLRTTATSARTGSVPILSGEVSSPGLVGRNVVVLVKRPYKSYWSYSSNRTLYSLYGVPKWQYKYTFKRGMVKGVYTFRATLPAYPGYLSCLSPNTVAIRLR